MYVSRDCVNEVISPVWSSRTKTRRNPNRQRSNLVVKNVDLTFNIIVFNQIWTFISDLLTKFGHEDIDTATNQWRNTVAFGYCFQITSSTFFLFLPRMRRSSRIDVERELGYLELLIGIMQIGENTMFNEVLTGFLFVEACRFVQISTFKIFDINFVFVLLIGLQTHWNTTSQAPPTHWRRNLYRKNREHQWLIESRTIRHFFQLELVS